MTKVLVVIGRVILFPLWLLYQGFITLCEDFETATCMLDEILGGEGKEEGPDLS